MKPHLAFVPLLALLHSPLLALEDEPTLSCAWEEYLASSFNYCLALATSGEAEAEYTVGRAYLQGSGIEMSAVDGENWITSSAQHAYPDAEYFLGQFHENRYNRGEETEPTKAKDWYLKASKHGHSDAQYSLALLNLNAKGLAKNVNEAIKWLIKSAEAGNTEAAMYLADLYKKGTDVAKNSDEALKWLRHAANNDHLEAIVELSIAYLFGTDSVPKDLVEAAKWLDKAADRGNVEAQVMLGFLLNSTKDPELKKSDAIKWFSKAIDSGHGDDLCQVYFQPRDYIKSGVLVDATKALDWCNTEAENGNSDAQFALAVMYKSGKAHKNDVLAYKWVQIAEKANHELSREMLKKWQTTSALSDKDRKKVDEAVKSWFKKHPVKAAL